LELLYNTIFAIMNSENFLSPSLRFNRQEANVLDYAIYCSYLDHVNFKLKDFDRIKPVNIKTIALLNILIRRNIFLSV